MGVMSRDEAEREPDAGDQGIRPGEDEERWLLLTHSLCSASCPNRTGAD